MSNTPWECPRCHKINAPFNPSCFCSPKEDGILEKTAKDIYEKLKHIPPASPKDWPPIPMYKEHGWLAAPCVKCGGYYGSGHNADNCTFNNQSM